jgi:hypothetical protein
MRLGKANFAGLASPRQQSEMKCILAGMWPPLKPLPVFKYETVVYRATIDFDKLRGEWVCRKTSFPSNTVQELRGGLREITMELPHGEAELVIESAEQPEQEQEQDAHRRLEAIRDWKENSESGKHYYDLRRYLSESQRAEIDDSLRLSLTARQLQFNSKNLAYVFDALSTAGGRFATLIAFAKRYKAKSETSSKEAGDVASESEREIDMDKQLLGANVLERGSIHTDDIPLAQHQEAEEFCAEAGEVPAVSIKSVLVDQDPASLAERTARTAPKAFEVEAADSSGVNSVSFAEQLDQLEDQTPALEDFAADVRMEESTEGRSYDSSSRSHTVEISAFQVLLAFLFLFAVIVLTVGFTMGFGPLGGRLMQASKSIFPFATKSPTQPDQKDEASSRTPTTSTTISNELPGINKLDAAPPSEEKSKENPGGSILLENVPSTDPDSSRAVESKRYSEPEVHAEHNGASGLVARNAPPPAIYNTKPSRNPAGLTSSAPKSFAPDKSAGSLGAAPHLARPSVILVDVPLRGSQTFRVSFPEKAIAATSSFAMSSQLSVLVSPGHRPPVVHRPARLEAGELISFVWPHFAKKRDRYGTAELVKVRVTIGPLGQVREVDFLSGSPSFLSATTRAIRQWRYSPTLLDKKPVQAQQDVTIEFRPGRIFSAGVNPASSSQLAAVK